MTSAFGAPAAIADEIVLANGDRLTGKVVSKEADTLVLNTPYAGDLNIRWADIRPHQCRPVGEFRQYRSQEVLSGH